MAEVDSVRSKDRGVGAGGCVSKVPDDHDLAVYKVTQVALGGVDRRCCQFLLILHVHLELKNGHCRLVQLIENYCPGLHVYYFDVHKVRLFLLLLENARCLVRFERIDGRR